MRKIATLVIGLNLLGKREVSAFRVLVGEYGQAGVYAG